MTETSLEKLIDERDKLLAKWQIRGLWIWEKFKLDNLDQQIEEEYLYNSFKEVG